MPATPGLMFERLLDWIEGRLSEEEASAVAALVAQADEDTQRESAWLRAFQKVSANTVLATPPPALHATLLERFAEFAANRQPPSIFQRLVAALTFDSALQPAMAGVRAVATGSLRQLIYATGIADIALNIQWREQEHRANLFGQVLPNQTGRAPEAFCIQLLQESREIAIVMADETGEFVFDAIEPGTYQVVLSTDDSHIVLPVLDLLPST